MTAVPLSEVPFLAETPFGAVLNGFSTLYLSETRVGRALLETLDELLDQGAISGTVRLGLIQQFLHSLLKLMRTPGGGRGRAPPTAAGEVARRPFAHFLDGEVAGYRMVRSSWGSCICFVLKGPRIVFNASIDLMSTNGPQTDVRYSNHGGERPEESKDLLPVTVGKPDKVVIHAFSPFETWRRKSRSAARSSLDLLKVRNMIANPFLELDCDEDTAKKLRMEDQD